ncbi:MAG: V-type ATP synthase subunit I [Clostridia bacterium]|nr:V-type ATP synthase subunit I [Clostridia bacterium]
MSVSTMKRLTVIATLNDADAILHRLMKLRAVSLEQAPADDRETLDHYAPLANVSEASARVARVEGVIPVLAKHSRQRKKFFAPQAPISPEAFRTNGRFDTAWKVVEETDKILTRQAELRGERENVLSRMRAYRPYLNLEFPLDFTGTETTRYFVGSLPGGLRPERIENALTDIAATVHLLGTDGTGVYIAVIAHRKEEDAALRALSGLGFLRAPLPTEHKTVKQLLDGAQKECDAIEEALARLETRLTVLSEKLEEVEILSDIERTALIAEENKQKLSMTDQCVILTGWCPASQEPRITTVLSDFCTAFEFAEPKEGDDVPILLRNNGFAKSFEWVLGMYAYPKYGTFDPTFIMSIFYFLIFGLMFADAGYGLTLMVACFGAVRWLHPRESMKRFLLMFGYCGISCTIFGILFGSYFGNFPLAFMENVMGIPADALPNLSLLPAEAANVAILFDPIQNPMAFLGISLGMGALHLIAGMGVKAFVLCRQGKVIDALFDIVTYWILFAGIGMLFVSRTVGIVLTVVGVASVLLTQGRQKKGIPGKIAGGFLGLYNLIGYASDLLSYCRVLALGLAASVIGQVVNILATLKGATFAGILLMLIVFTVGHLLNLVINILGTFVHTSRLQYIEFFNKFYEEGGTPFKPMAPADRYSKDITPAEGETTTEKDGQLKINFD